MSPVCERASLNICVLVVSVSGAQALWQLDISELCDGAEMSQVIEALDESKKWFVMGYLDTEGGRG